MIRSGSPWIVYFLPTNNLLNEILVLVYFFPQKNNVEIIFQDFFLSNTNQGRMLVGNKPSNQPNLATYNAHVKILTGVIKSL